MSLQLTRSMVFISDALEQVRELFPFFPQCRSWDLHTVVMRRVRVCQPHMSVGFINGKDKAETGLSRCYARCVMAFNWSDTEHPYPTGHCAPFIAQPHLQHHTSKSSNVRFL